MVFRDEGQTVDQVCVSYGASKCACDNKQPCWLVTAYRLGSKEEDDGARRMILDEI